MIYFNLIIFLEQSKHYQTVFQNMIFLLLSIEQPYRIHLCLYSLMQLHHDLRVIQDQQP